MRAVIVKCLLALVFGAAMTVSFAPSGAWWFTPLCMAGLFMLIDGCRARVAFMTGLCFGAGWFGAGCWWMGTGLVRYTEAGPALAWVLTGGLVLYLSLFPAVAAALACRLRQHDAPDSALRASLLLAVIFTLSEWMRAVLFSGMPMLAPGYAHAAGPLAALAPIVGVLGLTFVNALLAALLAAAMPELGSAAGRRRWRMLPLGLAALAAVSVGLERVEWTRPTGQTLTVSLLQGNLPQHEKFSIEGGKHAVETYLRMARASRDGLTVLPEMAFPFEWHAAPPGLLQTWRQLARDNNLALIIGTVADAPAPAAGASGDSRGDATNSALALLPGAVGDYDYRYDKVRLVPLGEQLPEGAGWLAGRVQAKFSSMRPGLAGQAPLKLPQGRVALGICYESMFDTSTAAKARAANLLVNISNFTWFDGSYGSAQHLQAGQMRARESGRWFVQAANSGMTAIVDHKGAVQDALPPEVSGILEGTVVMYEGETPFMVAGNAPLLGACLLTLTLGVLRGARRRVFVKFSASPTIS